MLTMYSSLFIIIWGVGGPGTFSAIGNFADFKIQPENNSTRFRSDDWSQIPVGMHCTLIFYLGKPSKRVPYPSAVSIVWFPLSHLYCFLLHLMSFNGFWWPDLLFLAYIKISRDHQKRLGSWKAAGKSQSTFYFRFCNKYV